MKFSIRTLIPNTLTVLMLAGMAYIAAIEAMTSPLPIMLYSMISVGLGLMLTFFVVDFRREGESGFSVYGTATLAAAFIAAPIAATLMLVPASLPILATAFGMAAALPIVPFLLVEAW